MDRREPHIEWVDGDAGIESREDMLRYIMRRTESQWNEAGWDQPFTIGVMYSSDMPGTAYGALAAGVVNLPEAVVAMPEQYLMPFAKLITYSTFHGEVGDPEFERVLLEAGDTSPDQDVEMPRRWMRDLLNQGGDVQAWFLIAEGFRGALPEGWELLDNDLVRGLPGVMETRLFLLCSAELDLFHFERERGKEPGPIIKTSEPTDLFEASLVLLTAASLKVQGDGPQ